MIADRLRTAGEASSSDVAAVAAVVVGAAAEGSAAEAVEAEAAAIEPGPAAAEEGSRAATRRAPRPPAAPVRGARSVPFGPARAERE